MNLQFLPLTPLHPKPLIPSSSSSSSTTTAILCFHKPPPKPLSLNSSSIPPRDRIIDFGKHKGKMLGTLSSTYLKWVSKNLRARDFEEWAILADQVLADEVYKDRLEWEYAERLLTGNSVDFSKSGQGAAAELAELCERFGWDNTDDAGWKRINFGLLGTSKGGRIPRIDRRRKGDSAAAAGRRGKVRVSEEEGESGGRRETRRERMRAKRGEWVREGKMRMVVGSGSSNGADEFDGGKVEQDRTDENVRKRFPGRESLMKKVIDQSF